MSTHFVTFATDDFLYSAKRSARISLKLGATTVRIWQPIDFTSNLNIAAKYPIVSQINFQERGAGYWLWKPLLILESLKSIDNGDFLVYCDAGVLPTSKFSNIIRRLEKDKSVLAWRLNIGNNSIETWTDSKVLLSLGVDEEELNESMLVAAFILIRNCPQSQMFIKKWLHLCTNREYLAPDSLPNYSPTGATIWHRHDQSLFSVLSYQYREFVCIQNVQISMSGTPFIPFFHHREKKVKSLSFIFVREITKSFLRIFLRLLPQSIRQKVRLNRNTKPISHQELLRHKKIL